jgi:hypothetical protein
MNQRLELQVRQDANAMPGVLEAHPQSDIQLDVSAAPWGDDGDAHGGSPS